MVTDEGPRIANFAKVPLDFQRPAFERGFALPKKSIVAVNEFSGAVIFGRVIAEQAQIKEIGRARQKFEGREIALVKRAGIGPNPANAALFEQANNLRPVPAGMTKFNRETKTFRKLREKFSQDLSAIFGSKGWRQLDQHNLELRFKRLNRTQKRIQFGRAIAQPANMRDFSWELATKTK